MTDLIASCPQARIDAAPPPWGGPRTFLSADLHLSHANIIRYSNRPFTGVSDMDEALIEQCNATVDVEDDVWVIADVALGRLNQTLPLVGRLNGHLHLVTGNHDRCWIGHSQINVGVDVWDYAPVAAEDLSAIVEAGRS